ncbi:MAG: hypothetical protein IPJ77_00180 [Planctomycetes bacterium]|nr:hypothetical protein [Planctomycetota bacterium]
MTSRASRATSAHSFLEARGTGASTSFRRFARGLVLVALLLPACGTVERERTPAETEALLQSVLARVAADEVLELWSPASASASATFLATAREQADLVRPLFEAPVAPPIRVYLVPTAMDERKDARGLPNPASQGGKEGGSFDEGFLFQFVPAGASERELLDRGSLATDTLRHEYAHAYSLRVGLLRAPWFHEGLATEVEYARLAPGVVVLSTYPHRWITARATLREGALAELLAWRRGEALEAGRGERLYAHAHTFFRFLLEREPGGTFLEKVRRIHALPDAELAALEPAWLAWWRALDPLETVRVARARRIPPTVIAQPAGCPCSPSPACPSSPRARRTSSRSTCSPIPPRARAPRGSCFSSARTVCSPPTSNGSNAPRERESASSPRRCARDAASRSTWSARGKPGLRCRRASAIRRSSSRR